MMLKEGTQGQDQQVKMTKTLKWKDVKAPEKQNWAKKSLQTWLNSLA